MAADIGPQSSTHELQQLAQQQPDPSFLVWSSRRTASEDDSWEVRAFAEDTSSIKGSTWPPRSYSCSFCKREFRSAQALGGHMNVHRRDRARLHQSSLPEPSPSSTYSSPLKLYDRELVTSGALSLLRSFSNPNANPNPNPLFTPASMSASSLDFPSTLLSISPYAVNNFSNPSSPSIDLPSKTATNTSSYGSVKVEYNDENIGDSSQTNYEPGHEELDLELRLGQSSTLQSK